MKILAGIVKMGFKIIFGIIIVATLIIGLINLFIIGTTSSKFYTLEELRKNDAFIAEDVSILVLGAGIIDNMTPSTILQLRLDKAYEVSTAFNDKKIIMSGDHMDQYYNEVNVMKNYVVNKGIPSNQVYLDHSGYSTYDSLYRLKHVLKQDKIIIITQGYHLSRALMLANGLGIDAIGIPADESQSTRIERELREIFARVKDFAVTYFGYNLPASESNFGFDLEKSGNITDNKENLDINIKKR